MTKTEAGKVRAYSEEQAVITIKYPGYSHIGCENDDDTKFIILRGEGRAFCAGGDIKDLVRVVNGDVEYKAALDRGVFVFHEAIYYMGCVMKTPIISIMNGITFGGGIGFSQLSSFKIATENTKFAFPEAAIGHFCDASASFTIPRMEGHLGVYLGLTGHQFNAEDAIFAGLATHFMDSSNINALEKKLAGLKSVTLDTICSAINEFSVGQDHVLSHNELLGEKLEIIESCFRFNSVELIVEALKRNGTQFAKSCLKSIAGNSPSSLKVNMRTIRRGATKSMSECISYEYRAWHTLPVSHDYKEGVRSLLEKKNPQWAPSKLEDIDDEYVKSKLLAEVKVKPYMDLSFDYSTSPHKKYNLPTREDVLLVTARYNLLNHTDVIAWFIKNYQGRFGVEQKVNDILVRMDRSCAAGKL
ncbi:hypothetical protein MFLAVUS_008467 [Mucor flavus]|uniref:3-hydroxyisobutyryl-CoA hydrolase n=1 Tax=Mucor flavus TaxID=439312 RepID=A0ABP9Z7B4_9FUNG